jgi:D-alanyl-D-alanine dipeptidase
MRLLLAAVLLFTLPFQDAPPSETGPFRASDLVELVTLDPTIKLDIRYATPHNLAGRAVYAEARAFLQRPAAAALVRAHRALAAQYPILDVAFSDIAPRTVR